VPLLAATSCQRRVRIKTESRRPCRRWLRWCSKVEVENDTGDHCDPYGRARVFEHEKRHRDVGNQPPELLHIARLARRPQDQQLTHATREDAVGFTVAAKAPIGALGI
jgi:hypothetical protein